ncbi:variant leucine-rich repeat-containing protein [Microbacterium sp.]|uniref:variant leucine-rich repeat-containing protein n=1 Tax=Microbacterium sp. TaxID=51671 RepID=UPI003F99DAC2
MAERLLADPNADDSLDRASILLAHCEQVLRAGRKVFEGSLGDACDAATSGDDFASNIKMSAIADVRSMLESNRHQLGAWRNQINTGERYEPNPKFAGSALVGGADGDWLIGDTLIDSKAYEHLTVPKLRDFLRQLLGYVMLDLDDAYAIRRVGIWLPRQRVMPTWSLSHLLSGDPDELLPKLRQGFTRAAGGKQVASYVPVSDRRKRIILSENWQTPPHMLTALACDEDEGIRWRVGRNPTTPVMMLGLLAEDGRWRVREAVASNERTPELVLNVLSNDRSVAVRRAVEANPRSGGGYAKALSASDTSGQTSSAKDVVVLMPELPKIQIAQDRDDSAIDESWFTVALEEIAGGNANRLIYFLAPPESLHWANRLNRPFIFPEDLSERLPLDVVSDLMREGRPAAVRRIAAQTLQLTDQPLRDSLLDDHDAEIRWAALERSVCDPDSSLGPLLGGLASSRKARMQFRTAGMVESTWGRPLTPKQYDQQVLELVARHPATPLSDLETLSDSTSPPVLATLLENPSLPQVQFESIVARMKSDRRVQARAALAAASTLPGSAADELAGNSNVAVRAALARNPAASPSSLAQLAVSREAAIRRAVFENPTTALDVWEALVQSMLEDSADMRAAVALDERTSAAVHALLAADEDASVRATVARNFSAPPAMLIRLASDPDIYVRGAAAENPLLPRDAIRELLGDEEAWVRRRARENPSTLKEDLELAGPEPERAPTAPPTREVFHEMAASTRAEIRKQAAGHPDVPPDVLSLLGGDSRSVHVRRSAAAHPSTPPATLRSLAEDKDNEVRRSVALNSATPADTLVELAGQRIDLALLVAVNPGTTEDIADSLAQDGDPLISYFGTAARNARRAIDARSQGTLPLTSTQRQQ